eukprot:snap_masked-scaffold_14-processed-gene-11.5-mRNA-1 protein AED:1.00 eAED:1.00 QI:0/-1/0/0/-1/1/1/0/163
MSVVNQCLLIKNYSPNLLQLVANEEISLLEVKCAKIWEKSLKKKNSLSRSKRRKDINIEHISTFSGRWTRFEEALVLRLTLAMINCELKQICEAANSLGIDRKNRAIDHKLKRMLGFKNWKLRNILLLREQIQLMITVRERGKSVSSLWNNRIEEVARRYKFN